MKYFQKLLILNSCCLSFKKSYQNTKKKKRYETFYRNLHFVKDLEQLINYLIN